MTLFVGAIDLDSEVFEVYLQKTRNYNRQTTPKKIATPHHLFNDCVLLFEKSSYMLIDYDQ